MAVDHRAAMARNMFDHRQKAACDQTIGKSAPDDRRRLRITRIGTIANRIGQEQLLAAVEQRRRPPSMLDVVRGDRKSVV